MALKQPKINLDDFGDMIDFTKPVPVMSGIMEMDFEKMQSFHNHKFKLYEGQQLTDMVESIRAFGILLPIILWHTQNDAYIILSGHNRKNAGQLAGLTKAPVMIKENLTHDEAILIVTETNLRQRSFADMAHSERAYCLAEHYEAMKSQGKRNDLLQEIETLLNTHDTEVFETSAELQQKLENREKIGLNYGLSKDKVAKYIRISTLIEPLIYKLDTGEIAFLTTYTLSFIEDKEKQQKIVDVLESENYKLDMKKADLLRQYHENAKLTETAIVQILSGEKTRKPKSTKPQPVKVKPAVISKYFTTEQSQKEIEEVIEKALEMYFAQSEWEV